MNFYTLDELNELFGSVGRDVRIDRSAVFFNSKKIHIGSHVRIDCFCLLSAGQEGIEIADYIHIASSTHLFGGGGKILLENFCNLSSRVSLFTSTDDYVQGYMTNPMVSDYYKKVAKGPIILRKHAIVGCASIILPNTEISLGGSVGALSLVKENVGQCDVVGGIPAKKIGERGKKFIELETELRNKEDSRISH